MEKNDDFIGSIKNIFTQPKAATEDESSTSYEGMVFVDSDATPEEVDQYIEETGKLS